MAINMGMQEAYSANGYTGSGQTIAETAQTGNQMPQAAPGVNSTKKSENVLGAWLLVAAVLIGITLLLERFSAEQTYGQVKLGFYNMVVIGFYSLLFITLGKVFFAKVRVPGLSQLFLAA